MLPPALHLHLDPLGGLSGDMFAAALLAAFPEQEAAVSAAVSAAAPGARCRLLPHDDGTLCGLRFRVEDEHGEPVDAPQPHSGHHHHHHHDHDHDHDHEPHEHEHHGHEHPEEHAHEEHGSHRAWRDIRAHLEGCALPSAVRDHALGIFAVLAEAEARVHGVAPDAVTFHEVGAVDSIADIVAAAVLVRALDSASWSVDALPLGGGRVRGAHGLMPVPAPATTLLLDGFTVFDDGIGGERVTPTGAAILRYLRERGRLSPRPAARLSGTGIGFGTRRLPGVSNCLRVLLLDPVRPDNAVAVAGTHRTLGVISFEVDDQTGEDLAAGLDRIRRHPGVHDVLQMAAIGKKGRMAAHIQVLASPDAMPDAVALCFTETTTIGLRTHTVQGQALPRRIVRATADGVEVGVKLVDRPDGRTGKAESDHLLGRPGHGTRTRLRRQAEAAALRAGGDGEDA